MGNKILTDTDYPDIIRGKLGLDDSVLSDTIIEQYDGVELAEKLVIGRLVEANLNYSTILAGEDALYLKMAAIFCVCALLARDFGQGVIRSERLPDYQYENFQIDMEKKEKDFWDKTDEFLCKIFGYDLSSKKIVDVIKGHTETEEKTSGSSSPY